MYFSVRLNTKTFVGDQFSECKTFNFSSKLIFKLWFFLFAQKRRLFLGNQLSANKTYSEVLFCPCKSVDLLFSEIKSKIPMQGQTTNCS